MTHKQEELLNVSEASKWASSFLGREVTTSNISYLIQYGRVKKVEMNGVYVHKEELRKYYESYLGKREINWKKQLGDDLNWALSFDDVKESETTKHVHRLHPYKGKFIPQLVEYFLDDHIDDFKKDVFFKKGDVVLDPFCGSGTTLIQANELGINGIGIDISEFNTFISNSKLGIYDTKDIEYEVNKILKELYKIEDAANITEFENELNFHLFNFNNKYFPSPQYKIKVRNKELNAWKYGREKEELFLETYVNLIEKYRIKLSQEKNNNFLDKWYLSNVREEIDLAFNMVKEISNAGTKKIVAVILSRTIRSCRATTHSDLATLKNPMMNTYYCHKHGKICKPIFTITGWFSRYSKDTIKRLKEFCKLRTDTEQICLNGDSRSINILGKIEQKNEKLYKIIKKQKIRGIFSSPPYVGLIDYHEQHAYAYDLFGFQRNDESEIGPLFKGQGLEARISYVNDISQVLVNSIKYLDEDSDIFLVANDKHNLYPEIAKRSGLKIINQYKRPVLNRTEKGKSAYSEIIFHMKRRDNNGTN